MNKISGVPGTSKPIFNQFNCTNSTEWSEFAGHGFDSSVALQATTLVTAISVRAENIMFLILRFTTKNCTKYKYKEWEERAVYMNKKWKVCNQFWLI